MRLRQHPPEYLSAIRIPSAVILRFLSRYSFGFKGSRRTSVEILEVELSTVVEAITAHCSIQVVEAVIIAKLYVISLYRHEIDIMITL